MFLYLSDVTAAHGPTRIVSRELTRDVPLIDLQFPRARVSPERIAEWEAAAGSAVGPKGSLLVYSADVVHRGTEMSLAGGGRFFFNLAYRAAGADWVGANPWPRSRQPSSSALPPCRRPRWPISGSSPPRIRPIS